MTPGLGDRRPPHLVPERAPPALSARAARRRALGRGRTVRCRRSPHTPPWTGSCAPAPEDAPFSAAAAAWRGGRRRRGERGGFGFRGDLSPRREARCVLFVRGRGRDVRPVCTEGCAFGLYRGRGGGGTLKTRGDSASVSTSTSRLSEGRGTLCTKPACSVGNTKNWSSSSAKTVPGTCENNLRSMPTVRKLRGGGNSWEGPRRGP